MHHPLSLQVRNAVAGIESQIDHSFVWGKFTQTTYPGEQAWVVEGGNEWPLPARVRVAIIATAQGEVEFRGLDVVRKKFLRLTRNPDHDPCERHALWEVMNVFATAKGCALAPGEPFRY